MENRLNPSCMKYNSLEDFLKRNPLDVDRCLDDKWDNYFPIKGIKLNATILFRFQVFPPQLHIVEIFPSLNFQGFTYAFSVL